MKGVLTNFLCMEAVSCFERKAVLPPFLLDGETDMKKDAVHMFPQAFCELFPVPVTAVSTRMKKSCPSETEGGPLKTQRS